MSREARAAPSRRRITFDDLPLFADDHEIAQACVGPDPERIAEWLGKIPSIEQCGFPRPTSLYNRRYTPAVRAYYDRHYLPPPPDGRHPAEFEAAPRWNDRRSKRQA